MRIENTCSCCGKTKKIEEFPKKANQFDRLGNPVYRSKCKACESKENLEKYHAKKAKQVTIETYEPIIIQTEFPKYIPKSKIAGRLVKDDEDYSPWEKQMGKAITDDERAEIDAGTREFILAMLDLVLKEKGEKYG